MATNRCQEDYVIDFGRVATSSSSSSDDGLVTGTPTELPETTETPDDEDEEDDEDIIVIPVATATAAPTSTVGIVALGKVAKLDPGPGVAALKELEQVTQADPSSQDDALGSASPISERAAAARGNRSPRINNWLGQAFGEKTQPEIAAQPVDGDAGELGGENEVVSAESQSAAGVGIDSDADGLSDSYEASIALRPDSPDTDSDGVPDGVELAIKTDPRNADSDSDGVADGVEIRRGTDPLLAD